jgi:hypothetical protein
VVKWADEHGVVIATMTSDGVDFWWHFAGWVQEQVALKIAPGLANDLATASPTFPCSSLQLTTALRGCWWLAPGALPGT